MNAGARVHLIDDPERCGTIDQIDLPYPPGAGWITVDWGDGMPTYHQIGEVEKIAQVVTPDGVAFDLPFVKVSE